jgi:hypothetical protein
MSITYEDEDDDDDDQKRKEMCALDAKLIPEIQPIQRLDEMDVRQTDSNYWDKGFLQVKLSIIGSSFSLNAWYHHRLFMNHEALCMIR